MANNRPINSYLIAIHSLLIVDSILLGLGIAAPCMTITPKFGPYTELVSILDSQTTQPKTFSMLSGIYQIYQDGSVLLSLMVLSFSIVFPLAKLGVLWALLENWRLGLTTRDDLLNKISALSKYSMLDVFVIAVLIVAAKGLAGGTTIRPEWGIYMFCLSILLSMAIPAAIKRLPRRTPGNLG